MGAVPLAIVDTIVGSPELAREALRGMKDACGWYDVALAGGHLTLHDGAPAVSAFGVGRAAAVLSTTNVAAGQSLIVAACTTGTMRTDFPFFRSFTERADQMAGDVRVLASLATSGACVAAKDVSMAGLVGSLAMLLEWSRLGVTLDLERLPRPVGVPMQEWLTCFPAYAFLLCSPPGRENDCLSAFQERGLEAAVVGVVDESGLLALRSGGRTGHRDRPRRQRGHRPRPLIPPSSLRTVASPSLAGRQVDAHGLVRAAPRRSPSRPPWSSRVARRR